ncbi:hypothetical protein U1Q18_029792 [Sarracenia purpurea var. burkii]
MKDITESGVAGDDGSRRGPVTRGQRVEAAEPASEGGEMHENGDRMVALGVQMHAKGGASAGECAPEIVGQWHHNGEEVDGGQREDEGAT